MAPHQCAHECTRQSFGLHHKQPRLFVTSQWSHHGVFYPIYRSIVAIYFFIWLIISGGWSYRTTNRPENDIKWFIYLTNWAVFWMTVSLIIRMVLSIWGRNQLAHQVKGSPLLGKKMTWYLEMSWVLYNSSNALAVVTSILYWGLLWKPIYGYEALDFNTHAMTSLCILVDLFITAMPMRLLHVFQGMFTALVYILFSIIYDVAGGTNGYDLPYIYSVIDWTGNTGWAVAYALLVLLVIVPITWVMMAGCYHFRIFIYSRCCANASDGTDDVVMARGVGVSQGAHNLAYVQSA